jgi:hypothetical protein
MDGWTTVRVGGGPAMLEFDLPPRWWSIHPNNYATDVAATVETTATGLPSDSPMRPELTAELGRLARVSAAAGVLLLAGGSAGPDPTTGKIATASLTVMPHEAYLLLDRSAQEPGPVGQFILDAGEGVRRLWLGPSETALGRILMLEADYVVAPPQPPSWVLTFQTPALERRIEMVAIFDSIVSTVRIHPMTPAQVARAFG